jgi:hypothetical protein
LKELEQGKETLIAAGKEAFLDWQARISQHYDTLREATLSLDVNGKSSDRIGIGILPTVIRSRRQIARLARRPSSDGELVVDRL